MVPALLWRELGSGLSRNPVPEDGLLSLEFAGLVAGFHPIGDVHGICGGLELYISKAIGAIVAGLSCVSYSHIAGVDDWYCGEHEALVSCTKRPCAENWT